MSNHGRGKIRVEDDFVRFMNLLALHYTDELGVRSSPAEFNRHMDNIAPSVIRSWFHYLKHEGDLTLQQAILPSGDYATYKADKNGLRERDNIFAGWIWRDKRYWGEGKGKRPKTDRDRVAEEFPDDQEAALKAWQRYRKRQPTWAIVHRKKRV